MCDAWFSDLVVAEHLLKLVKQVSFAQTSLACAKLMGVFSRTHVLGRVHGHVTDVPHLHHGLAW